MEQGKELRSQHPGTIVFVDGKTGQVLSETKIDELPDEMLFAETETGQVPVVKIVAFTTEEERRIFHYGPGEICLKTTLQIRNQ